MPITRASAVPTFELQDKRVQVIASEETGACETLMVRGFFDPESGNTPHSHDHEEVVLFLSGGGHYVIGAETFAVFAGDVVVVPAGELHAFTAAEKTEAVGVLPAGAKTFNPAGAEIE